MIRDHWSARQKYKHGNLEYAKLRADVASVYRALRKDDPVLARILYGKVRAIERVVGDAVMEHLCTSSYAPFAGGLATTLNKRLH